MNIKALRALYRYRRHFSLVVCIMLSAACWPLSRPTNQNWQPTAPTVIPNVDAGVPPPVVVVTPPPADSTTSPDSGDPLITDIELPTFIVGGDEGNGTVRLSRGTTKAVTLTFSTSDRDVEIVPATIAVAAGVNSAGFRLLTHPPHADTPVKVTVAIGAESRSGTFTLALPRPINRADAYTAISGRTLVVASPGILDNDTRRQGHDLMAVLITNTDFGTLSLSPSGGFTYVPESGYTGHDRFIYRAVDGVVSSGAAHVNITVIPAPAPPDVSGSSGSRSFSHTGGTQSFIVPAGVTQITIDASGAQGGASTGGGVANRGGSGGNVKATFAVTPGETLTVVVGGKGGDGGQAGFNGGGAAGTGGGTGGGGGGSSNVRRGGTTLVIAGGGGGGGQNMSGPGPDGANGGGTTGASAGGGGGTQSAGGAGGAGINAGNAGSAGSANAGGAGGNSTGSTGGGGGGGFFGGGGGGGATGPVSSDAGGGGSSFVGSGASNVSHTQGARAGAGLVVITW